MSQSPELMTSLQLGPRRLVLLIRLWRGCSLMLALDLCLWSLVVLRGTWFWGFWLPMVVVWTIMGPECRIYLNGLACYGMTIGVGKL
uniref:Uncharacterized protein MANES_18G048600 n=1 Tax=Rhizophora mucronata TaxID=61149 RepID=A0A2P2JT86_RHIMU